jgi:hypothetical protein
MTISKSEFGCKKQRGDLLAFRIQVKENSIENPVHTVSVTKDTHGSSPSLYFPKRSFYKIGGADLPLQGHLGLLKLLRIQPLSLLGRKFHLIKREQIVNL